MGDLFSKPDVEVPPPPPPPPDPAKVDVTSDEALRNARQRVLREKSRRGRGSLRIPLAGAAGSVGGVSIPK